MRFIKVFMTAVFMLGLTVPLSAHGEELHTVSYRHDSYKEAERATSFLRFDMKSRKVGLLTTSFTGYVHQFELAYKQLSNGFQDVRIRFQTESLDTDVSGRNSKMWEHCLDSKNHPEVALSFPGPILFDQTEVMGTILIRGVEKPIRVSLKFERQNGAVSAVEGKAVLSLKALDIPDPSILVAKVLDDIQVAFRLEAEKK